MIRKNLVDEILSLSEEEKAEIVNVILSNSNLDNMEIDMDEEIIEKAERRLEELKTGKVRGILSEVVFNKIFLRLKK